MNCLKIPPLFTQLVMSLFTNCSNKVITADGLSDPYKVQIGIDQGEVISLLLWVIYIDPLLTALNNVSMTLYNMSSSVFSPSLSSSEIPNTNITINTSTLAFMDDTTLISSSLNGLVNMLNLANEFYIMNNTKINFSKAELIANRDPITGSKISPAPLPFTFNLATSSFTITPIAPHSSFRFLGVWFSLSSNHPFVRKQCLTEYNLFTHQLRNKRLTSHQLIYLHNDVVTG